jgi:hypothetical protein
MKQMSKQTAVQWFINKDTQATIDFIEGKITSLELAVKKATFIEQAKEMEKEQIEDAYDAGVSEGEMRGESDYENEDRFDSCTSSTTYYNETYGGDK